MTEEKPLKKLVRYYVYLMYFVAAVALFGFSTEPFVMRILIWLFFCLVVYRSIYNRYFLKGSEKIYLKKVWLRSYEGVPFAHVLLTIFVFFAVWGVTYGTLKTMPILKPYESLIALINSLIYSFFYFAQVFDD